MWVFKNFEFCKELLKLMMFITSCLVEAMNFIFDCVCLLFLQLYAYESSRRNDFTFEL